MTEIVVVQGVAEPPYFDLPSLASETAFQSSIRCVCVHEAPVPDVGAVMVYGLALVGVGLTAFALGALQRRRRRFA